MGEVVYVLLAEDPEETIILGVYKTEVAARSERDLYPRSDRYQLRIRWCPIDAPPPSAGRYELGGDRFVDVPRAAGDYVMD